MIYSLDVLLSQFWTSPCSMSSTNYCFLTCKHIFQETSKVIWYSHLFKNFPQFVEIWTVKGFSVVNEAEVDVFLKLLCFLCDPTNVGNLISASSASLKPSLRFIQPSMSYYVYSACNSLDVLFLIWNQSVVPCSVLTVASWPAYRFLRRQVRWLGIPISWRIFHSLL